MNQIASMMHSHPTTSVAEVDDLARCIDSCLNCGQTCLSCADACQHEEQVRELLDCIQTDLDCADICLATSRILSRIRIDYSEIVRGQLELTQAACRVCADECDKHAQMHEHCRICADVCRDCAESCRKALKTIPVVELNER